MLKLLNLFRITIPKNRIFGLDVLRAIAILTVVFSHGRFRLPDSTHELHHILNIDGVSIFFVLSGFLIGGILIKSLNKYKITWSLLGNFWMRRWLRTLPIYLLILTVLYTLYFIFDPEFNPIANLRLFIFSQNIFSNHTEFFFPEAWSLSIEEWFYLIFPLVTFILIIVCKTNPIKALTFVAILILLSSICYRVFLYLDHDGIVFTFRHYLGLMRSVVFTRLDSLMVGVLGALWKFYNSSSWFKNHKTKFFMAIGVYLIFKIGILVVDNSHDNIFVPVFGHTLLVPICTLFTLPYLLKLKVRESKTKNIITKISLISYSMYLVNLTLIQLVIMRFASFVKIFGSETIYHGLDYIIYWTLTIVMSAFLYNFIEIPFMNLRDKAFFKNMFKLSPKNVT